MTATVTTLVTASTDTFSVGMGDAYTTIRYTHGHKEVELMVRTDQLPELAAVIAKARETWERAKEAERLLNATTPKDI